MHTHTICTRTHAHRHTHTHTHTHYMHTYTCTNTYTHVHRHAHTDVHRHAHTDVHRHAHKRHIRICLNSSTGQLLELGVYLSDKTSQLYDTLAFIFVGVSSMWRGQLHDFTIPAQYGFTEACVSNVQRMFILIGGRQVTQQ